LLPNAAESEQSDNETVSDTSQLTSVESEVYYYLAHPDSSVALLNKYPMVKAVRLCTVGYSTRHRHLQLL